MDIQNVVKNSTGHHNGDAVEKPGFMDASVKNILAGSEVQSALKKSLHIPEKMMVKKVRNAYKNPDTGLTTQKVSAKCGTSLYDVVDIDFTLVGQTLDAVEAVNHMYRPVEYTFSLNANMTGGKFGGYSATGFKLLVTKLEEVDA